MVFPNNRVATSKVLRDIIMIIAMVHAGMKLLKVNILSRMMSFHIEQGSGSGMG